MKVPTYLCRVFPKRVVRSILRLAALGLDFFQDFTAFSIRLYFDHGVVADENTVDARDFGSDYRRGKEVRQVKIPMPLGSRNPRSYDNVFRAWDM